MIPDKTFKLEEIVARFGGELIGDSTVTINQISSLEKAQPSHISFLTHGKYRHLLLTTRAAAVILGEKDRDATSLPRIVCDNPYAYFARVSTFLNPVDVKPPGVHSSAQIHPTAKIAASVHIGPYVCIGAHVTVKDRAVIDAGSCIGKGVIIGCSSHLFPNTVVYHECVIGDRAVLHSGVVVGADGFGIAMDRDGWVKIPQIGRVVIGNDVEIGANTTIDRGTLDDTVLEDGVKLDNQIQVGHNVRIGAHTAIAGCAGIAGSASIGRYCKIGGGAVILGHLNICDHVDISAGTVVTKSIDKPGAYTGIYPFGPHREWLHNGVNLRHLDKLSRTIDELEKKLEKPERGKT